MDNQLLDKPLFSLTAREFIELLAENLPMAPAPAVKTADYSNDGKYAYHLSGIAELFGCSRTTANRLKQSGRIDAAIVQVGNLIIVDKEKALTLAGMKKRTKK